MSSERANALAIEFRESATKTRADLEGLKVDIFGLFVKFKDAMREAYDGEGGDVGEWFASLPDEIREPITEGARQLYHTVAWLESMAVTTTSHWGLVAEPIPRATLMKWAMEGSMEAMAALQELYEEDAKP